MADVQSNEVPFAVLEDEAAPPHVGLEVEIYKHDDPNVRIDVLPDRWGVSSLDEIRKPGGGSFSLWRNDPKLLENPAVLDWRNIVRIKLNHETVGAFLIQKKEADIVSRDEISGEIWEVAGEGLRSWFRDATVLPYGGLKAKSAPQRVFSFASEQGAWYKPADWHAPVLIQQHNLDPNPGPWGTAPAQWPDAPDAWWVWGVNNNQTTPAPAGFNFFRYEFDIAEGIGTKNYSLFAAGDNQMVAYIDAQEVITADENDSWTKTWRADVELDPGHHIIAFRVLNTGTSPAALIAAFFRAGDAAAETAAELLTTTGQSGWLVNPYPDPAPGWTAGEIMLTLLAEADTRGVQFPAFLTPTFDAEVDSAGEVWTRALDWNFGIGTEYYEVIERLEEAVCDLWIDPDLLTLNMYVQRGVDRTQQTRAVTPIKFEVGRNILRAHEEGTSDIKNTLALATTDGFFLQSDALTDSISKYGRVEGLLSTGLSPDVSGDVANSVFAQKAVPTMASTYEIIDIEDARPFVDYGTGDYVLAPNADDEPTPIRILSLSVAEDAKTGRPVYAMEFGTISDDVATRHERWLKSISNASLGGTVVNAGGGGSGSSANPAQATQDGPQGTPGPAGPAGMTYRGIWLDSIEYSAFDSVTFGGSTWISNISENTDSEPAEDNTDWTLLAASGVQGESAYEIAVEEGFVGDEDAWLASLVGPAGPAGPGITYRGGWSSTTEYVAGDLVHYTDGLFYLASAYSLNQAPDTGADWDEYTAGGGVPIALTPNILYGTDGAGDQTTYALSASASAGAVAQRTAQSTLMALTTADGGTGDSDEVLVNKGFLARFRGDAVTNVTLANAGSTACTATQDVIFFSGSTVATYTVTLPTGLTAFKRITLAFLAEVTALTLNPGAGNTVNVAPTSAPVNTVLVYEYNVSLTKWILVSQYPVGSGGGGSGDEMEYQGAWDPALAYDVGDVVEVPDGTVYVATTAHPVAAPAASFIAASGNATTGGSPGAYSVACPAGTVVGDLQIMVDVGWNSYGPIPAGWTVLSQYRSSVGSGAHVQVAYRTAPDTAAIAMTANYATAVRTFRGASTPTDIAGGSGGASASFSTTTPLIMHVTGGNTGGSGAVATYPGMIRTQVPSSYGYIAYSIGDHAPVAGTEAATSSPGVGSAESYAVVGIPGTGGFNPSGWAKIGSSASSSGGDGITFAEIKGAWSSSVTYAPNDVVLRNGDTYVAGLASTNVDPGAPSTSTLQGSGATSTNSYFTGSPVAQKFTVGSAITISEVEVTSSGSPFAVGTVVGLVDATTWTGARPFAYLSKSTLAVAQSALGALRFVLDSPVTLLPGTTYALVADNIGSSNVGLNVTSPGQRSGVVATTGNTYYSASPPSGPISSAHTSSTLMFGLWGYVPSTFWILLADGVPDAGSEGFTLKWVAGKPTWASVSGDGGFKGAWSNTASYSAGDTVTNAGSLYGTTLAIAAGTVPTWTDSFSSTLDAKWVAASSGTVYATSSGRLTCTTAGSYVPNGSNAPAVLVDSGKTDHSFQITNYRISTSGYSGFWIAYADASNWLYALFDGSAYLGIVQCVAGTTTTLTSLTSTIPVWAGTGTGMTFFASIDTSKVLTVKMNGTTVYTTTLSTFSGTKVGVGDTTPGISTYDDATIIGSFTGSGSFDPSGWIKVGITEVLATRRTTVLTATSGNSTATLSMGTRLIKVQASVGTRFRLYRSTGQRSADAARPTGTDPVGDAVLLDINFVTGSTYWLNPIVDIANDDATYYTLTSATADITLTWEATA